MARGNSWPRASGADVPGLPGGTETTTASSWSARRIGGPTTLPALCGAALAGAQAFAAASAAECRRGFAAALQIQKGEARTVGLR
eukprot:CAMPEP_0170317550 /NCGR_PEP_ID=MMETSP0116_2-20130129/59449_1 /TAXON_ID=400756 /ORGANISM="Durinskia baltica, Strain CSIRO CS-38" /LENGTH=84 /DNA_ID=CAMNT_0010570201 /DNA_START=101 /DNA_END=352 /DNA_ORIENTATION=+